MITHKYIESKPKLSEGYRWLYVGAHKQDKRLPSYSYDDTGKNISYKNTNFCELTGMYWIRYNSNEIVKGLVHYRRFFTHNVWSEDEKYYYTYEELQNLLKKHQCIVSDRCYVPGSISESYERTHNPKDLAALIAIIEKYEPDYIEAFRSMLSKDYFFPFNMVVASGEIFDMYTDWLLELLFKLEESVDLSGYDQYQSRMFGFLSERLLGVWLLKNNIDYIELPTIQLGTRIRYKVRTQLEKKFKRSLHFLAMIDAKLFGR